MGQDDGSGDLRARRGAHQADRLVRCLQASFGLNPRHGDHRSLPGSSCWSAEGRIGPIGGVMPARWSGLGAADTLGYRLPRNRTEFGPERLGVA